MITETLCNFGASLIEVIFSAFEIFKLPLDTIDVLAEIMQYGCWVVGSDVLLLFSGSVALWWGIKASVGIGVWAYEHIPVIGAGG